MLVLSSRGNFPFGNTQVSGEGGIQERLLQPCAFQQDLGEMCCVVCKGE